MKKWRNLKMERKRELEEEFKRHRLSTLRTQKFIRKWKKEFGTTVGIKAVLERTFLRKVVELAEMVDDTLYPDERRELIKSIKHLVRKYEEIEERFIRNLNKK